MLRSLIVLAVISAPLTAFADSWSYTTEIQPTTNTSLRIVEPEGYRVTVRQQTNSVPAVFTLPNADDYVTLAVVAPNGASWENKIEVKPYKQTVVRITHRAERPAAAPVTRPSHVGILFNTSHLCRDAKARGPVRLEFIEGAATILAVDVPMKSRVDAKLPAAEYQVRVFGAGASGWEYRSTLTHRVTKDGWHYEWGCQ